MNAPLPTFPTFTVRPNALEIGLFWAGEDVAPQFRCAAAFIVAAELSLASVGERWIVSACGPANLVRIELLDSKDVSERNRARHALELTCEALELREEAGTIWGAA